MLLLVANEVKELLFVLEKRLQGSIQIKTINYHKKNNQFLIFNT